MNDFIKYCTVESESVGSFTTNALMLAEALESITNLPYVPKDGDIQVRAFRHTTADPTKHAAYVEFRVDENKSGTHLYPHITTDVLSCNSVTLDKYTYRDMVYSEKLISYLRSKHNRLPYITVTVECFDAKSILRNKYTFNDGSCMAVYKRP
jgi:hypothetical protein